MKKTKSNAILGIIAIICGLLTAFVLTPLYGKILEKQTDVVRVKSSIIKGRAINKEDIEVIKVAEYGLSNKVIREEAMVVGKYANSDMYAGNYITAEALSEVPLVENIYLENLPEDKYAISVTVQSFAAGLSSKLTRGDIVAVLTSEEDYTEIPPSLMYVEVLSTTEESGKDTDAKSEAEKAEKDDANKDKIATVTLLVNSTQASDLVSFENKRTIHLALKCRNNEILKERLLKEQEEFFVKEEGEFLDGTDNKALNEDTGDSPTEEATDTSE